MNLILQHLPVLLILLPLLSAALCFLIANNRVVWWFVIVILAILFSLSLVQITLLTQDIPIIYEVGGWSAPWGIEISVDNLNAFLLVILTGISVIAALYAKDSVISETRLEKHNLFYTAYLLNLTGLIGVVLTGDAFNQFVFIEISALSSYGLVALGRSNNALYSAFRYLVFGTVGATFILIGIGFLYVMTGTLNMSDMSDRLGDQYSTKTVLVGMAFIITGILIKLALFPFHVWLPDVYRYSPTVMTVFFSATTTKVFIYVLIRYFYTIFDHKQLLDNLLPDLLMFMSAIVILYGSYIAIISNNIKKIFAYSSLSQIGYMVLGLSFMTESGLTASLIYLFNHAHIKAAVFLAIGCMIYYTGKETISSLNGLSREIPLVCFLFVLSCIALIGIPSTSGFISKWHILSAAIEADAWLIVVVILLGSLFSIVYVWRCIEAIYFTEATDSGSRSNTKLPALMFLPLLILVFCIFYFGIFTQYSVGFSSGISGYLMAF